MTTEQRNKYQDLIIKRIENLEGKDIFLENRLWAKVRELAIK
tara:strand:+ start:84 stop:209 length:126 start_codon:yes stop_codon:yes gene_type:complete